MANRHSYKINDIRSVIERLQELVMAHSGEDVFEEIFKILVAKMYAEIGLGEEWRLWKEISPDEAKRKFDGILARSSKYWPGILDQDFAIRLKPDHLLECLCVLEHVSLSGTDLEVLDHAFEFLVSHTSKGSKGQYFTPRQVIECCVRIIDPKPTELVFDPACGSGGFLFHALKHVERVHGVKAVGTYSKTNLWGADFDVRASKVAKALLILAGADKANIFKINSLLKQPHQQKLPGVSERNGALILEDVFSTQIPRFTGFDVILTNPPFAGEIADLDTLSGYSLAKAGRRMERDVLFIERCVELLKPGGRMALVVPHNKVGAGSWAYMREWLLENVRIVSVVGLNRETFLPHTHQKTSVLFCQKRVKASSCNRAEDILFQVSSRSGKDGKGRSVLRPKIPEGASNWERVDHDFDEVVGNFHAFARQQSNLW